MTILSIAAAVLVVLLYVSTFVGSKLYKRKKISYIQSLNWRAINLAGGMVGLMMLITDYFMHN